MGGFVKTHYWGIEQDSACGFQGKLFITDNMDLVTCPKCLKLINDVLVVLERNRAETLMELDEVLDEKG